MSPEAPPNAAPASAQQTFEGGLEACSTNFCRRCRVYNCFTHPGPHVRWACACFAHACSHAAMQRQTQGLACAGRTTACRHQSRRSRSVTLRPAGPNAGAQQHRHHPCRLQSERARLQQLQAQQQSLTAQQQKPCRVLQARVSKRLCRWTALPPPLRKRKAPLLPGGFRAAMDGHIAAQPQVHQWVSSLPLLLLPHAQAWELFPRDDVSVHISRCERRCASKRKRPAGAGKCAIQSARDAQQEQQCGSRQQGIQHCAWCSGRPCAEGGGQQRSSGP